jgi:hypothetical protein
MTTKTILDADLASFDSTDYPWCIVTADGHVFYQKDDVAAYQTAMAALGLTVDDSGNIVQPGVQG